MSARQVGQPTILAIEYLCAAQAIEFLPKLGLGQGTGAADRQLRSQIPSMDLIPEPDWPAEIEARLI